MSFGTIPLSLDDKPDGFVLLSMYEKLESENAKLREERDHWHVEQVHAYGNWEDAHKRAAELQAENTKLRELARGLHMAYVGALNEAEGMDAGLIWEHCEMVDAELAKSHARFEVDRHRFDVAMRELGVEVES